MTPKPYTILYKRANIWKISNHWYRKLSYHHIERKSGLGWSQTSILIFGIYRVFLRRCEIFMKFRPAVFANFVVRMINSVTGLPSHKCAPCGKRLKNPLFALYEIGVSLRYVIFSEGFLNLGFPYLLCCTLSVSVTVGQNLIEFSHQG